RPMRHLALATSVLALLSGCTSTAEPPLDPRVDAPVPSAHAPAKPTSPADVPVAPGGSATSVVDAGNQLGLDLYARLRTRPGNLAYSPASIALALSMTYAGAAGTTAAEMARVLHLPADGDVHAGWATVASDWAGVGPDVELGLANRLFGAERYPFRAEFTGLVRQRYGAPLELVDFGADPEAARAHINGWVKDRTHERITDLIPAGQIDALTSLVLTNALYFKATWAEPFDVRATRPASFHASADRTVEAPFMHQTEGVRYADTDAVELVELPYRGGRFAALFVLPKAKDGLAAVEQRLDAATLGRWVAALAPRTVSLALPRFKVDPGAPIALAKELAALGMPEAFDEVRADFSGMSAPGAGRLHIREVFHKAFVAMDEAGTEAAAATAVIMGRESGMAEPATSFEADHPFLFFVRDTKSGLVAFAGRVADPTAR
ncbi:MAG: serpin family protein, partial [Polyangiaceae bacterium]|nr:serpin family protein [Polyangiaceae bacterium]